MKNLLKYKDQLKYFKTAKGKAALKKAQAKYYRKKKGLLKTKPINKNNIFMPF
jgi:hypothetical protein